MIRNRLFILLLLVVPSLTFAQKPPWQKVVMVNAGVSVPFADYADNTFSYRSGFANPGGSLEANFLFYRRWLGLSASLGYSSQTFAKKRYISCYNEVLDNTGITSVTAGIYQSMKATAGFAFRLFDLQDTELLGFMQAGITLNVHPNISVNNSYWGEINSINRDADWQSTSVLGVLLKHNLTESTGVNLSYTANFTLPGFRDESNNSFHLPMRFQNITLGIFKNL